MIINSGEMRGEVADEVDHLPLALHLAGSFLERYRYDVTPTRFLVELRDADVLRRRDNARLFEKWKLPPKGQFADPRPAYARTLRSLAAENRTTEAQGAQRKTGK